MRCRESEDERIRQQAGQQLFYHYMNRKDYERAEALLGEMPQDDAETKKARAALYMRQNRYAEAKELLEKQLLQTASDAQSVLAGLQSAALAEGDTKRAGFLADTCKGLVRTLQLWEYGGYSAYLDLYCKTEDVGGCIRILDGMLEHAKKPWKPELCELYRDIPPKQARQYLPEMIKADLLDLIRQDDSLEFLRESAAGKEWLAARGIGTGGAERCADGM